MERPPSRAAGDVQLKNLSPPRLAGLIESLLANHPGIRIHHGELPPGTRADLVIQGTSRRAGAQPARLSVNGDGVATLEVQPGELSSEILRLAVELACGSPDQRNWLDALLEMCARADELLERATRVAAEVYGENGAFDDWRVAFAAGRFEEPGPPLATPLAEPDPAEPHRQPTLLASTGGDHAFARLVREYGLDGREVDVLLLAFVHQLDARYGRRYAYLQRDPGLEAPTVDLLAALLARDAADRIAVQRALLSGALVRDGLVTVGPATLPHRSQVVSLDSTVTKILLGDETPAPGAELLEPAATPRAVAGYAPPGTATAAAAAIRRGVPVHLHGGVAAERRSAALDIAHVLGERLLVVAFPDISEHLHWEAGRLRRECVRLQARCLVDQVPARAESWQRELAPLGTLAISAGEEPARPADHRALLPRWNAPAGAVPVAGRAAIWAAASRWTGITVVDGDVELVAKHGVTVDRAAAALAAAGVASGRSRVDLAAVVAALSAATADDAGGLLHTIHPRVTLDDLVLTPETERALRRALGRIRNRDVVIHERGWDQRTSRLSGTYLLFAGPSGTGKTMAAEALAGELSLPVQYLEISSLFSRWVGDFEAAVDKVFAAAAASRALLVVNEADAILGPRTEVVHGQDRYANAGTSHILSRLEQYTGHVVFTSNLVGANHIDPAFHRRLTDTIRFHPPDEGQRRRLWESVWPTRTRAGRPVTYKFSRPGLFDELARDHAISGGSIANIARTATFLAAEENTDSVTITERHLREALAVELAKIGDFRSLMLARAGR